VARLSAIAVLLASVPARAGVVDVHVFVDPDADGVWSASESSLPGAFVGWNHTLFAVADDAGYFRSRGSNRSSSVVLPVIQRDRSGATRSRSDARLRTPSGRSSAVG
jgi:hypothetical protein